MTVREAVHTGPDASLSAQTPPTGFAASFSSANELYSETYFQNVGHGAATQTRVRREWTVGGPQAYGQIQLYFGAVLERNLNAQASAPLIQNAASPELGLLYHPFSWITIWIEERYRIADNAGSTQPQSDTSDPRAGLALGRLWEHRPTGQNPLDLSGELYGESVLIPRLAKNPVTSGFVRGSANAVRFRNLVLSAYTELNEFSSPSLSDLGPSRTQLRAGARFALQMGTWNGSVFIYRPWQLSAATANAQPEGLEGLFVLGGRF